jgi:beta-fructofuranosidase
VRVEAGSFERIYDPSVGEAERWYLNDHSFVRAREGTWHLFGITHAEPANPHDEKHLAHATAPALHGPWTKQPFALSADPSVRESVLWAPHAVEHGGRYWMFVCDGGPAPTEFRIQLATSDDCTRWTRHPENPLLVDGYEARDPMVLWLGDRFFIGPDWEGLLASKARSGRYDWKHYRGTRVLESDDPFHFTLAGQVGFLDAHAAEVVLDEAGASWVSHWGWGQGRVYLAPLRWDDAPAG